MIISAHLCGVAVAYPENGKRKKDDQLATPLITDTTARAQGSLISYQKRQIADAVEWIRLNAVHKPMIFVCTTSNNWGPEIFNPKISQFTNNLRNGYGCQNYVWVKEFNGKGSPHYHFVADIPFIKSPIGLSYYWSSLFGYSNRNCVRLGSQPGPDGKRKFYVNSRAMAFYLSKYLAKGKGEERPKIFPNSWLSAKVPGRSFGISETAGFMSKPILYKANWSYDQQPGEILTADGKMIQRPAICSGRTFQNELGEYINPNKYTWKQVNKDHPVFIGKMI